MKLKNLKIFIGKKVQYLREAHDYSQEDLADLVGLTRVSITNIEAGRQAVNLRALYLICCILDTPPNFFFPPLMKPKMAKKKVIRRIVIEKKRFIPIK